jgi:cell division protein ZapA
MERLVKFEVLGQEYPLYTNAPEEDIEVTSLTMAGKYVSLKRDFEHYKQQMNELVDRLASAIESSLPPDGETQADHSKKTGTDSESKLAQND